MEAIVYYRDLTLQLHGSMGIVSYKFDNNFLPDANYFTLDHSG
jgi:hypothetical protein